MDSGLANYITWPSLKHQNQSQEGKAGEDCWRRPKEGSKLQGTLRKAAELQQSSRQCGGGAQSDKDQDGGHSLELRQGHCEIEAARKRGRQATQVQGPQQQEDQDRQPHDRLLHVPHRHSCTAYKGDGPMALPGLMGKSQRQRHQEGTMCHVSVRATYPLSSTLISTSNKKIIVGGLGTGYR